MHKKTQFECLNSYYFLHNLILIIFLKHCIKTVKKISVFHENISNHMI